MTIPTTLSTLVFIILFFIPGLLFEQGIERNLTYWRTNFQNRFIRFSMWSFIWTPIMSPIIYGLWKWHSHLTSRPDPDPGIMFIFCALVLYVTIYIALPFTLGKILGQLANEDNPPKIVDWILGKDLAPSAWDNHFRSRTTPAWVRIRMKETQQWLAGTWTFASSYPEPEDIAIDLIECDPFTGEIHFESIDGKNVEIPLEWKMIVRREDIDLIAWQPTIFEEEIENDK